jgi:hypothetical protein
MNLDLFADLEPVALQTGPAARNLVASTKPDAVSETSVKCQRFDAAAREWAQRAVEDLAAASDAKTRLKNLKEVPGAYDALVDACAFVAWRKREAYRCAFDGGSVASLEGWVVREPELAQATECLTRSHLAINELAMLPPHLGPVTP